MLRGGGKTAVELVRLDVDSVEERLPVEVQRQRDDGDRTRSGQLRWKVRSRVGDDGDRVALHDSDGSMGGSVKRRFLFRKNRCSSGLIATSITITRKAVKMATA